MTLNAPEFALAVAQILSEEQEAFGREAVEVSMEQMARIILRLNKETVRKIETLIHENFPLEKGDFLRDMHLLDGDTTHVIPTIQQ